jgi:hypothetical protein
MEIKGGLIHYYSDKKLLSTRDPQFYPDSEKKILKILSVSKKAVVHPIGSFTLPIQKYPSDIDIDTFVHISKPEDFIHNLRKLVKRITSKRSFDSGIYFSDFKAGIRNGEAIHWKPSEIMKNTKLLIKSITQKAIIKLDIIVLSTDRVIEASTFFVLEGPDGLINVSDDFLEHYAQDLYKEIQKYKKDKPFKAIKRLWSLSKLSNNVNTLQLLAPAIDSNLSLLSQINADLETLELMIKNPRINITRSIERKVKSILNGFLKKLSTIADIDISKDLFELIESMKLDLNSKKIEIASDYISKLLKDETNEYLNSINLKL